jgi:hypothetical protein
VAAGFAMGESADGQAGLAREDRQGLHARKRAEKRRFLQLFLLRKHTIENWRLS